MSQLRYGVSQGEQARRGHARTLLVFFLHMERPTGSPSQPAETESRQ